MTSYSVIIPSYNSHVTLRMTLDSLARQTRPDLLRETIVVDSSDDGVTPGLLEAREDPWLRVVRLETKTMPGPGRNLGAKQATGDVFVFVDSDVILADDWLEQVDQAYAAGGRAGSGSISIPRFQRFNLVAQAQHYLQFNEFLAAGPTREKEILPSCNMWCDASLFRQVGGFPDIRAAEDVVFFLRLREQGGRAYLVPAARCFHVFGRQWARLASNQRLLGHYVAIYRREHRPRAYLQGKRVFLVLPAILGIKAARIALRIASAGGGHLLAFAACLPIFLAGLGYWAHGFVQGCMVESGGDRAAG